MSDDGMKSAYELALERMARDGIEPPRQEALEGEAREAVANERQKAEARLAELEILHRDRLAKEPDPLRRHQTEEEYVLERRSVEERRDRAIARIRHGE